MDYNLAKQLKDAGFPQNYPEDLVYAGVPPPRFPDLSELIKACGESFENLSRDHTTEEVCWLVNNYVDPLDETKMTWYEGSTPEEAVARLYLELHN